MKIIIALWHTGNKGKTKTLIELGNLLLIESTILYCNNPIDENKKLSKNEDFTLVVELSEKRICITSKGDPNSELKKRLQDMINDYNVDYLFCATRTKGETVSDIYNVSALNDYEILWTSTYHSDNEKDTDFFNELKAKHLLDMLKELISRGK